MAREMALAGVDRSELTPPPPPEKPRTLKGKWDNFWYHYKVVFWIVATLVVIAAVIVVQMILDDPADYEVVAVTEYALFPAEIEAMEAYLASVGEDLDGDGKVEVHLENLVPTFDADGTSAIGLADQQKLVNYIAAGEKMLFVFDPFSYEGFNTSISDVTSEDYVFFAPLDISKEGYDQAEHYWCMSGDPACEDFGLMPLATELLLGVRTPEGTAGNREAVKRYEQGKALIEALAK